MASKGIHVLEIVVVSVDAHLPKISPDRLSHSWLAHDAAPVGVQVQLQAMSITRFSQQGPGLFLVVSKAWGIAIIAEMHRRDPRGGLVRETTEDVIDDPLHIDGMGNGLTHPSV